jgi:hypothetical protein
MPIGKVPKLCGDAWRLIAGDELRQELPHLWKEGNSSLNSAHPALDWRYVHLLYKYFGVGSEILAVSSRCLALLQPYGYGRWQTFLPSQSCVGSAIFSPDIGGDEILPLLASLASVLPGRTFMLSFRKQDSAIAQLSESRFGDPLSRTVYGITTAVDTTKDFEAFWQARSKSLRQSVRRRFRSVEKDGIQSELKVIDSGDAMPGAVADYSTLEMSGWKGRQGTALDGTSQQSRFYEDLLTTFAEAGQAVAYQLRFDGQVVASLLTIHGEGVLIPLKTAFDEGFSRYSPGRLLDYLFLQNVFADPNITIIENYTDSTEEDRRWCSSDRPIIDWDYYPLNIIRWPVEWRRKLRALLGQN